MPGELLPYKADLHVHTALSPCAGLEMSPGNIVKRAKESGIRILGITDHNSTRNAVLVKRIAEKEGITVLTGAEITTKEEVHCLAFFETENQLGEFQDYLDEHITRIPNPDGHFGYQPVLDENDDITELVPWFLSAALNKGISEVQQFVHQLEGIFIPAHIDRPAFGIFAQLGFIPSGLHFDALGITARADEEYVRKHYVVENNITLVRNSDAHYIGQVGSAYSVFNIKRSDYKEIKLALNNVGGRFVSLK